MCSDHLTGDLGQLTDLSGVQISDLCVDLMVDKADVQLLIQISSIQDLNISQDVFIFTDNVFHNFNYQSMRRITKYMQVMYQHLAV